MNESVSSEVCFDKSVFFKVYFERHSHRLTVIALFKTAMKSADALNGCIGYTLPSKSFLIVKGKITKGLNNDIDTTKQLICNAPSPLFDEMKYKLCETEIYDVQHF